jgi:hypothetical protein
MPLREIEKDLQGREPQSAKRGHDVTVYDVWRSQESEKDERSYWSKIKDRMQNERVRAIVFGGIAVTAVVIIVLGVVSFTLFQRGFFSQERVALTIDAPVNVDSNTIVEMNFSYNNDNRAQLSSAEIIVQFGDYFVPTQDQDGFAQTSQNQGVITLGTINGRGHGSYTLAGTFIGPRGAVDDIVGTLRYVPEKTTSRYQTVARAATTITSSPIVIDVQSEQQIVSGNLVDISFSIKNMSTEDLSMIKLIVDIPQTFSLYSATPIPNYGTVWLINDLSEKGEYVVHMRGSVNAPVGTTQVFDARVVAQADGDEATEYAKISYAPRIVKSPIIVQQSISGAKDDVVFAGDNLDYKISFRNDSDVALRDAIVTVNLESAVLDYGNLSLRSGGDYDEKNHRIVWKASDVPALKRLAPGDTGTVEFTVSILRQLPVVTEKDFHFYTTSVASIDSEDIPTALRENKAVLSNVLSIPVGAKVVLTPSVQYASGAAPLTIGEKTVYTVTLRLDSINNDLEDVSVRVPLPTHTRYEGSTFDNVTFNERSNEFLWDIGDVVHGAGVTSDPHSISFDVSIVPSTEQSGTSPTLINDQEVNGKDRFTNQSFYIKNTGLRTEDDPREDQLNEVQ